METSAQLWPLKRSNLYFIIADTTMITRVNLQYVFQNISNFQKHKFMCVLRGNSTSSQNWACFVCYLKHPEANCPRNSKWHYIFNRPVVLKLLIKRYFACSSLKHVVFLFKAFVALLYNHPINTRVKIYLKVMNRVDFTVTFMIFTKLYRLERVHEIIYHKLLTILWVTFVANIKIKRCFNKMFNIININKQGTGMLIKISHGEMKNKTLAYLYYFYSCFCF